MNLEYSRAVGLRVLDFSTDETAMLGSSLGLYKKGPL